MELKPIFKDLFEKYSSDIYTAAENDTFYIFGENPNAISLLESNIDNLSSYCLLKLCKNPDAIHILEYNIDKINRGHLTELCKNLCEKLICAGQNTNYTTNLFFRYDNVVRIIAIIEKCIDKISEDAWIYLAQSEHSIGIIERNFDKIKFNRDFNYKFFMYLRNNPAIFQHIHNFKRAVIENYNDDDDADDDNIPK